MAVKDYYAGTTGTAVSNDLTGGGGSSNIPQPVKPTQTQPTTQQAAKPTNTSGMSTRDAQQMLKNAGYDIGSYGVDGVWGKDTQAAWDKYQADQRAAAERELAEANKKAAADRKVETIQQQLAGEQGIQPTPVSGGAKALAQGQTGADVINSTPTTTPRPVTAIPTTGTAGKATGVPVTSSGTEQITQPGAISSDAPVRTREQIAAEAKAATEAQIAATNARIEEERAAEQARLQQAQANADAQVQATYDRVAAERAARQAEQERQWRESEDAIRALDAQTQADLERMNAMTGNTVPPTSTVLPEPSESLKPELPPWTPRNNNADQPDRTGGVVQPTPQPVATGGSQPTTGGAQPTTGGGSQPTTGGSQPVSQDEQIRQLAEQTNPWAEGYTGTPVVITNMFDENRKVTGVTKNGKTTLDDGTPLQDGDRIKIDGNEWFYDAELGRGLPWDEWIARHPNAFKEPASQGQNPSAGGQQPTQGERPSGYDSYGYQYNIPGTSAYSFAPWINAWYDRAGGYLNGMANLQAMLAEEQIRNATESGIRELSAAYDRGKQDYDRLIGENRITAAQAGDNLALRNAANGDRGGIGAKLYSDQQASYDSILYNIKLEQINLKNQTDQQVADLISQGQYEKARQIAEIGTELMRELYAKESQYLSEMNTDWWNIQRYTREDEQIAYQRQREQEQQDYERALQLLNLGIVGENAPEVLGAPRDYLEYIANYYGDAFDPSLYPTAELQRQLNKGNGSGSGSGSGGGGNTPYTSVYERMAAAGITDEMSAYGWLRDNKYSQGDAETLSSGYLPWYQNYTQQQAAYQQKQIDDYLDGFTITNKHTGSTTGSSGEIELSNGERFSRTQIENLLAAGAIQRVYDFENKTITYVITNPSYFNRGSGSSSGGGSYSTDWLERLRTNNPSLFLY